MQALHRVVTISSLFRSSHNVFLVYFGLPFQQSSWGTLFDYVSVHSNRFRRLSGSRFMHFGLPFLTEFWGNLCNPGLVSCPYLHFWNRWQRVPHVLRSSIFFKY